MTTFEGHQTAILGLLETCAYGVSESTIRKWSRPRYLGPENVTLLTSEDRGRNIDAGHRAIIDDYDWHDRLAEHELIGGGGIEGRDVLSPLYSGLNFLSAARMYWDHERKVDRLGGIIRRWMRSRLAIGALLSVPTHVSSVVYTTSKESRTATGRSGMEHWRLLAPTHIRIGSRIHPQVATQHSMSDVMAIAVDWPNYYNTKLADRIHEWRMGVFPKLPNDPNAKDWMPSYLDEVVGLYLLATRHGVTVSEVCGLTETERRVLRRVIEGDPEVADLVVNSYLLSGTKYAARVHRGCRQLHLLRDRTQCSAVMYSSPSSNKPSCMIADANLPMHMTTKGCRSTMIVPSPWAGVRAAPSVARIVGPGKCFTLKSATMWRRGTRSGPWIEFNVARGGLWHYVMDNQSGIRKVA